MKFLLITVTLFASALGKDGEVCYKEVGCFNITDPWYDEELRPVPSPRDPKEYPIEAIMYQLPHGNDTNRFNLYPKIELSNVPFRPERNYSFIIIPGFAVPLEGGWPYRLKNSLLNRRDANVFVINSTASVQFNVFQAISDARVVGAIVGNLIDKLKAKGLNTTTLHVIGYGLGAHVAGYASHGRNIGRITGLDPMQYLFEGTPPEVRLDEKDANFVDVLHSDARSVIPEIGLGYINPIGHVDFYINGGHSQPGCSLPGSMQFPKNIEYYVAVKETVKAWVQAILCPHNMSPKVFIESIMNDDCIFTGYIGSKKNFLLAISNAEVGGVLDKYTMISKNCTLETCTPVGLDTHLFPFRGVAIVTTSNRYPLCVKNVPSDGEKTKFLTDSARWYYGLTGQNKQ